jgi:hypothetical protein
MLLGMGACDRGGITAETILGRAHPRLIVARNALLRRIEDGLAMRPSKQRTAYAAIAGGAILVVLLPALWLDPTEYGAWAAGVQGCAVAVALSIGGATVAADRRERRVARALDLLCEYETGLVSVGGARAT